MKCLPAGWPCEVCRGIDGPPTRRCLKGPPGEGFPSGEIGELLAIGVEMIESSAEGCLRGFPHSGTSSPEATSVAIFVITVAEGWLTGSASSI